MAVELKTADAPTWAEFVVNFDKASKSFGDNRAALARVGPYLQVHHPELLPQYRDMVTRADALAGKLAGLKSTRDTVSSWFGSIGQTADALYQGAVDATSRGIEAAANAIAAARRAVGLGELGFAPIVVAIGAAAALATLVAVAKWITDAYVFAQRVNALQDLEARGYPPAQAATVLEKVLGNPDAPGGIERSVSHILWLAGGAFFVVFVLPKLLDEFGSNRK